MRTGFEETQTAFKSASQTARVVTERWAKTWMFCPNCGNSHLSQFSANRPVADFYCEQCGDEFELKSQSRAFGKKVADGAYSSKIERLSSDTSPNLILLQYDLREQKVVNLNVVPKHFFTISAIEKRTPLKPTARRAGWVGSNILLNKIPPSGIIGIVKGGLVRERSIVLQDWKRLEFLRHRSIQARGWLLDVLNCVDKIGQPHFSLPDIYAFEGALQAKYPDNNNVRAKIRQQLQKLRDNGHIEFLGKGDYRLK